MDQVSAALKFFARDEWVQRLSWDAAEQVLELTLVNRKPLRTGRRFPVGVSVRLLVPTSDAYPYLWFAAGENAIPSSVTELLEEANAELQSQTVSSVGLVSVVSSLILLVRKKCDQIWPEPATATTNDSHSRSSSSNTAPTDKAPPFELSLQTVEEQVIAQTIENNLRGCELLVLMLQLAANSPEFERLCSPFPEVRIHTGAQLQARALGQKNAGPSVCNAP